MDWLGYDKLGIGYEGSHDNRQKTQRIVKGLISCIILLIYYFTNILPIFIIRTIAYICFTFYLSEFFFIMPPVPPLSKKARKSPVWEFMDPISPSLVKRSLCQSTLTYCKTTSNLMKHLVTKHPLAYAERHGGDPAMPVTSTTSTASAPSTSSEGTTTGAAPSVSRPSQRTLQDVLAKKDGYK